MSTLELPALYVDSVALVAATPRLVLVNRDPSPGESGVPIDATIALELVDTGPDGVERSTARVWIDGVLAFDGSAVPELAPGSRARWPASRRPPTRCASCCIRWLRSRAWPRSTCACSLRPWAARPRSTRCTVRRRGPDCAACRRRTGARAEDRARGIRRVGAGPERASFHLTPKGAPAVSVAVAGVNVDGSVVLLTLDTEMTPDVLHEVVAVGVTDLFGNAVLGPYDRATFTGFRPARPERRASTCGACCRSTTARRRPPATCSASSRACRR